MGVNIGPGAAGSAGVDASHGAGGAADPDLSGRDRLAFNVLSSWGSYFLIALGGFVMPRLTDHYLGQSALGVWDVGWTLVNYFGLARIGVKTSINRYVAKYRSTGDVAALRGVVSSVFGVNLAAVAVILMATTLAVWGVPRLLGPKLGANIDDARWVVALLGLNVAVQVCFDVYPGVLSGCHRWDLHNYIMTFFRLAGVGAMATTLTLGGGLPQLALVTLCCQVATELTRVVVVHRVCPELQIRPRHASWAQAKKMIGFGVKSSLGSVAWLILIEGTNLLVAGFMGPAALAAFSRPQGLLHALETFANKFAFVLTPTASSLQHQGRREEIKTLFLETGRFGAGMVIPAVLGLVIMGEPILLLWMGPRYAEGLVIAIFALGSMLRLIQLSAIGIMVGLNMHGRLALAAMAAAVMGVGIGLVNATYLHWGLPGFALALAIPQFTLLGAYTAIHACRRLGIPLAGYLREIVGIPVLCAAPFAAVLIGARVYFAGAPLTALTVGSLVGAVALIPPYWRYVVPLHFREQLLGLLHARVGAVDQAST